MILPNLMSGLFESIEHFDDSHRVAHRKATAVANKRVKDRFSAFFANAVDADRAARLALVRDEITEIVASVTTEYGGDAEKIEAAILRSLAGADHLKEFQFKKKDADDSDESDDDDDSDKDSDDKSDDDSDDSESKENPFKEASDEAHEDNATEGEMFEPDCPRCGTGGVDSNNRCIGCGYKYPTKAEEEKQSSTRTARRPKMCPYHSEVTDISLGAGDPQAGFNAMGTHAWGDKHCKGEYSGTCNFKPSMVTQKYWDDKKTEYEQRALERQNQPAQPDLSLATEPIMNAEPLETTPGDGVTDINTELAEAPSAVGGGVGGEPALQMAARQAADAPSGAGGTAVRESLPSADESGLGGPSPKIDKGNSGDERGWSLDDIDTQSENSPEPTVKQNVSDKAKYDKKDFLDQTDAVTTQETLPSNSGDAGFDDGGENKGKGGTWTEDNGTDPVTNHSLESTSAVDVDKNPIRAIMGEHGDFLYPSQVEAAISAFEDIGPIYEDGGPEYPGGSSSDPCPQCEYPGGTTEGRCHNCGFIDPTYDPGVPPHLHGDPGAPPRFDANPGTSPGEL